MLRCGGSTYTIVMISPDLDWDISLVWGYTCGSSHDSVVGGVPVPVTYHVQAYFRGGVEGLP